MSKTTVSKFSFGMLSFALAFLVPLQTYSAPIEINDTPLFVTQGVPPLTMLVMGRDHKLYYEAYNDASDIDGDGVLDITYKPDEIDYYGYFDSYKCYNYDSSNYRFNPMEVTPDKKCSAVSGDWSGDFLNYITTARIDALRKVLYGGSRYTDDASTTVLERSYIPQDAHSWGKEYKDIATSGYDIRDYTPYSLPSPGRYHLFANTTDLNDNNGRPLMRVNLNNCHRVWEWLSIERPVADRKLQGACGTQYITPTDYTVRVKVCDISSGLEENCHPYGSSSFKPTGLLHNYGENGSMKFGLLTGSYTKNQSGGVLRKNIGDINNEIDPNTGVFTGTVGIIKTIDRLKIVGFGGSYVHNSNCGFIFNRQVNEGECRMWGNPVGEMMYESLRYFAGKNGPTGAFNYGGGGDDGALGLPKPGWQDPYDPARNEKCAKPNMIVISDINTSFDSDQLPGSHFSSFSGDLAGLNVKSLGQTIWNQEMGTGASQLHFIGESNGVYDGTPSSKTVTSFGTIRGLAPEEPDKRGSYYSASVAYHGTQTDLHGADEDQKTTTYVVALSSPLPKIIIPVNGQTVQLVPFGKSVGGCGGINKNQGAFQPSDQIVDFYVETITPTYGKFRVNFEDVGQGADHDMDAIVEYEYQVAGNNVSITLNSTYAAGCVQQHMGYVISGTTADGPYLEVRDKDTSASADVDYFLDTPNTTAALPTTTTRTFTVGGAGVTGSTLLQNPLWYAAKWGGFIDLDEDGLPNDPLEWDANADGVPDTYFLVTNPELLFDQLDAALNDIIERSSSASAASLNSGSLSTDTRVYQAVFNSESWEGQLLAFRVNTTNGEIITTGNGPNGSIWDAGLKLPGQNGRAIISMKQSTRTGIPFRIPAQWWNPTSTELDKAQFQFLRTDPDSGTKSTKWGKRRLTYIRGATYWEVGKGNGGIFRDRPNTRLGDIINSGPLYVGAPAHYYPDVWPGTAPESANPYSTFKATHKSRIPFVYVGGNDGMLHGFRADNGREKLAYVPAAVIPTLNKLTSRNYSHQYYVDSSPNFNDVYFGAKWNTVLAGGLGKGGQAVYALDITNPASYSEGVADDIHLWEFSDLDDPDMGFSYSRPQIVRLNNGKWAAIFGNGYNNTLPDGNASTTGNAVLFIVDIETGAIIKKIDTGEGAADDPTNASRPNGLATPAVIDMDGDYIADYVYAGDLFGNLWKFSIKDSNPTQWDVAIKQGGNNKPLFIAADANGVRQPITSRPNVSRTAGSPIEFQVFFGTGLYLGTGDKTDMNVQAFYGIKDDSSNTTVAKSSLLQQSIVFETTVLGFDYRVTSDNTFDEAAHKGWYMNLVYNGAYEGERVVSDAILRDDKVIFSTLIPSTDVCEYGGSGWLMELNAYDGGRFDYTPFDVNQDGQFNQGDFVSYGGSTVPVSGRKSTVGIIPAASILKSGNKEYKYTPGTSGGIEKIDENPGTAVHGRKSWRQLK